MAIRNGGTRGRVVKVASAGVTVGALIAAAPWHVGSAAEPPAKPSEGAAAVACPATEFDRFFAAFSERAELQEAFTRFPLRKWYVDPGADPEPKRVERTLARADAKFPLIPPAADRARRGWQVRVKDDGPGQKSVKLSVPDTGQQVIFRFEKGACWQLVEIDDQSI